jgi:hypothetical protein
MTTGFLCAIRGPVMLITLGVLLSIDHFGTIGFGRTWPVLMIVYGIFWMMGRSSARSNS